MLHMNILHTCVYVYAPCMNLTECLDLGLQIVVSHNVDVETWTLALWKNQQLLFSSLENNLVSLSVSCFSWWLPDNCYLKAASVVPDSLGKLRAWLGGLVHFTYSWCLHSGV